MIKAEIVAPPEDQEIEGEEIKEGDFENAEQGLDQQQDVGNQQEEQEVPEGANNNNLANNGVQGGQLRAIPVYTGNRGLNAMTYADAIDGSIPQFGWPKQQLQGEALLFQHG